MYLLCLSEVRLVNGGSSCSGRVEVLINNQWGTVCGDSWDMTDAEVVCRELGCGSPVEVKTDGYFGSGIGPIWMDDVKCKGTEASVKNCPSTAWGVHNCEHAKDAGVICRGKLDVLELSDCIFLLLLYMFPKYIPMYGPFSHFRGSQKLKSS